MKKSGSLVLSMVGSSGEGVGGRIGRAEHPCHAVVHAVVVGVGIEGDTAPAQVS